MSDENGDAPEHGALPAEIDALPATLDPALGGRLDSMHRTLSTLGMRIDALVTSTTTYRTALADRLTEYTDLVSKLTRNQAADLEEYRRANERTIADLRRGLANSEELLERVTSRIDSVLNDAEASEDQSRRVMAEVRSILEAQENLSRFLTESLDGFGDQVIDRLSAAQAATAEQLEALHGALREGGRDDDSLRAALAPLDDRIGKLDEHLRDTTRDEAVADRIAALDARLSSLVEHDPAAAVGHHLDTLHAAMGLLATADQVGQLAADVRAQLVEVVGATEGSTLVDQLTRIERDLTSSSQVAAESWGEFAGLRAKVDAILDTSANETAAVSTMLDEMREALLDVASGEVMAALWDELRGARTSIDEALLAAQRAEEAATTAAERTAQASAADGTDDAGERIESLRSDVTALTAAVRDLLEQAEVVDETAETPPDGMLTAIAADVSTLRHELSRGLVVEPSDALAGAVDHLRADVAALDERLSAITELQRSVAELQAVTEAATSAGEVSSDVTALDELRTVRDDITAIGERLDSIGELQGAFTSLRDEVRSAATHTAPAAVSEDLDGELATLRSGVDGVTGELRSVRSGVEDIIARLDEGLVVADELTPPAADIGPVITDHMATLRDQMITEFEALRRLIEIEEADDQGERTGPGEIDLSAVTELLEHVRDDLAELPQRLEAPAAGAAPTGAADDRYAAIDPDTVDLLREEIRAAGAVPDDLLDQLRKELVALRRRIKLRAEGEVLSDEQLELIADAVARKLAE